MGITIALAAHISGTILAAILVYFATPYLASFFGMEISFCYIVLYSILGIWSIREGRLIEEGNHAKANRLNEIINKEEE